MPVDEPVDSMKPAKTGPFGILARLGWLAVTLWGLYQIIFDWPSLIADTEIFAESGIVLVTASLSFFSRTWSTSRSDGTGDTGLSSYCSPSLLWRWLWI